MSARYFLFLYVEEKDLDSLLNLAIYCLNPSEKWPAHVTLAGPFKSRKPIPNDVNYVRQMSVLGMGQFRSETQNTVFLNVGTYDLRSVWNKPDYDFKPHLTLYDGKDHSLGDRLFESLKLIKPFFSFNVTRLQEVRSTARQSSFELRSKVDPKTLSETSKLTIDQLGKLSTSDRIFVAERCIERAAKLAQSLYRKTPTTIVIQPRPQKLGITY